MLDDASGAPQEGSLLAGRYRLGDLLGIGAMAHVHRADDLRLERPVAVKLFHPDPDPLGQRRFADEAQALARLSHPGLVSIFDTGVHDNRPYLVMQLVDGESLRGRLLVGPLPTPTVVALGAGLAAALAHVHLREIVHRDVKPSNILLDADGAPHLADFGIALLSGAVRLTGSSQIIGTPAYLAPEQVLGRPIGPATDVYALGLVLLECLTGEVAYPGGNKAETALARLHRPPFVPGDLPAELAALLTMMTAVDAARRPSAQRCADAFAALAEPGAPTAANLQPVPQPGARGTGPLGTGVLGAGVAGAGMAGAGAGMAGAGTRFIDPRSPGRPWGPPAPGPTGTQRVARPFVAAGDRPAGAPAVRRSRPYAVVALATVAVAAALVLVLTSHDPAVTPPPAAVPTSQPATSPTPDVVAQQQSSQQPVTTQAPPPAPPPDQHQDGNDQGGHGKGHGGGGGGGD